MLPFLQALVFCKVHLFRSTRHTYLHCSRRKKTMSLWWSLCAEGAKIFLVFHCLLVAYFFFSREITNQNFWFQKVEIINSDSKNLYPETLILKSEILIPRGKNTRNSDSEIRNSDSDFKKLKSEIMIPKSEILIPKGKTSEIMIPRSWNQKFWF